MSATAARRNRTYLVAALALVALLGPQGGAVAAPSAAPPAQQFLSRPDLKPPVLQVKTPPAADTAPGQLFFAPRGGGVQSSPVIMDNNGQLVWSGTRNPGSADFRVQQYRGKPVLTFWQGKPAGDGGHGSGTYYLLDNTYHLIGKVNAGHGYQGDVHEFNLTDRDSALITSYVPTPADLSSIGGPKNGWALDSVFQEIDVATGKVLFEWHSLKHIPVSDSYIPGRGHGTKAHPLDYFHINSVDRESGGDYLVSGRHTQAVYRIDGRTGKNEWLLGGKRSKFTAGAGAKFNWQHDARFVDQDTISLFDNADNNTQQPPNRRPSRAVLLDLNTATKKATLAAQYGNPNGLVATTQGSAQQLGNGNMVVGWGSQPHVTEFARDGKVLFDANFGASSYRAYRFEWHAAPTEAPTAVGKPTANGQMRVAVSWHGATEVRRWQLLAGPAADQLSAASTVDKAGFETTIDRPRAAFVQLRALDALGRTIGTSPTVPVR